MNGWIEHLRTTLGQPVGSVVLIGAGAGGWAEACQALQPRRTLLVEGEVDLLPRLHRLVAGRPGWSLHAAVLADRPGLQVWHRYNLSALNGPLDALELQRFFPRLQRLQSREVEVEPIGGFLAGLPLPTDDGLADLLLLDLPGQECSLLEAIPTEVLQRFHAVVLRGCAQALPPSGCRAGDESEHLSERSFRVSFCDRDSEPLWPTTVYRFDEALCSERQMAARLHALQVQPEQREDRLLELSAELEVRQSALTALTAAKLAAEQKATERAAHFERLTRARDEAAVRLADAQAELIERDRANEALRATLADRDEQVAALEQREAELLAERNDLSSRLQERLAQLQTLSQTKARADEFIHELKARREALEEARSAAEHKAAERAQHVDRLTRAREEMAERLQALEAQLGAITGQRDELQAALSERVRQADGAAQAFQAERDRLAAERAALEAELQERLTQFQALSQAKARADEIVQELEAGRAGLEEARRAAEQKAAERAQHFDRLTRARETLAEEVQALASRLKQAEERASASDAELQALREQASAAAAAALERQSGLTQRLTHAESRITELTKARDDAAAQLQERLTQLQTMSQTKARADEFIQEQKSKLEALREAKAASDQKAAERAEHFDRLTRARDELSRQVAVQQQLLGEAEAARTRLDKEHQALLAERDAQVRLAADRQRLVAEKSRRIQQLEADLADAQGGLQAMHQELTRAEQQLEILKDIFLQEPQL